jgi:hypothetical protein
MKQSGHGHCEALAEQDSELGLGHGPLARSGIIHCFSERFNTRKRSFVAAWEMTPSSDRPAEFGIQSLNSIRGI